MEAYETGTFVHNNRNYHFSLYYDDHMGAPWKEHDGHGPVSDHLHHAFGMGSKPSKAPGERILYWERGTYRTYDVAEATRIAKRDGWGLGKDDEAALAQRLGRAPTRKQIIAEAVQRDFDYIRGWCTDEWHWCWMEVTHPDTALTAILGGLVSSEDEHLEEVRRELAEEVAADLDEKLCAMIVDERPDMQPGFRP